MAVVTAQEACDELSASKFVQLVTLVARARISSAHTEVRLAWAVRVGGECRPESYREHGEEKGQGSHWCSIVQNEKVALLTIITFMYKCIMYSNFVLVCLTTGIRDY